MIGKDADMHPLLKFMNSGQEILFPLRGVESPLQNLSKGHDTIQSSHLSG